MTKYRVLIDAEITAKNFDSAQKKLADLERRVRAADVHTPHVAMKGEKS